ncbi:galactokinase [Gracilimonas sp. Q87]|uniref:galactokinase n=1 Tax=Gracilimonas sp. Q87 TaxID=3384766 RepID=UPI00398451EF
MTELEIKIKEQFLSKYDSEPILINSPGRVNLIGDHTDYNDGFVLPAAIDKVIVLGIASNKLGKIRAFSADMNESVVLDLNDLHKSDKHWANYIKGVVAELQKEKFKLKGFDVVFGGNIPIGAGLSSSAALEGALTVGLNKLFKLKIDRKKMARIGQLTEHKHVGVKCGIMDQFINLHGEPEKALKLDCRTLDYDLYPFHQEDNKIVLCNSKVSHNLAESEYNVRRSQCEKGVKILKKYDPEIQNLRDVSMELLMEHQGELGPVVFKRCKFVLEENKRVHNACEDLSKDDLSSFGQRMFESHEGLSNDYEVSCEELDILVELAKDQPGLLGCRMMGGGFGGCTINLVENDQVKPFTEYISKAYKERTGIEAEIYITRINGGARIIE